MCCVGCVLGCPRTGLRLASLTYHPVRCTDRRVGSLRWWWMHVASLPQGELDGPVLAAAAAARAALEEERAVRSAQDADLQQSLATDAAGALAAEQQPEVLAQAQAHEQTVAEAAAAAQHISGALAAATRDAVTTLPVRRCAGCTLAPAHIDTILCTSKALWNNICRLWRSLVSFTSTLSRTSFEA